LNLWDAAEATITRTSPDFKELFRAIFTLPSLKRTANVQNFCHATKVAFYFLGRIGLILQRFGPNSGFEP